MREKSFELQAEDAGRLRLGKPGSFRVEVLVRLRWLRWRYVLVRGRWQQTLGVLEGGAPVALQVLFPLPHIRQHGSLRVGALPVALKQAIFDFVRATINRSSPNYVFPADRIAVFDQDGTLWVEHPMYTQVV